MNFIPLWEWTWCHITSLHTCQHFDGAFVTRVHNLCRHFDGAFVYRVHILCQHFNGAFIYSCTYLCQHFDGTFVYLRTYFMPAFWRCLCLLAYIFYASISTVPLFTHVLILCQQYIRRCLCLLAYIFSCDLKAGCMCQICLHKICNDVTSIFKVGYSLGMAPVRFSFIFCYKFYDMFDK